MPWSPVVSSLIRSHDAVLKNVVPAGKVRLTVVTVLVTVAVKPATYSTAEAPADVEVSVRLGGLALPLSGMLTATGSAPVDRLSDPLPVGLVTPEMASVVWSPAMTGNASNSLLPNPAAASTTRVTVWPGVPTRLTP